MNQRDILSVVVKILGLILLWHAFDHFVSALMIRQGYYTSSVWTQEYFAIRGVVDLFVAFVLIREGEHLLDWFFPGDSENEISADVAENDEGELKP